MFTIRCTYRHTSTLSYFNRTLHMYEYVLVGMVCVAHNLDKNEYNVSIKVERKKGSKKDRQL